MTTSERPAHGAKPVLEPLKDSLMSIWFGRTCGGSPLLPEFASAMIERFVSDGQRKVLVDPGTLASADLSIGRLRSDIQRLSRLVDEDPEGFERLAKNVADAKEFRDQARKLGLTEPEFLGEGGGWGWLIVVPIALLLSGCGDGDDSEEPVISDSLSCGERSTGMTLDDGKGGGKVWSTETFPSPPGGTAEDTQAFLDWKAMVDAEIPSRLDKLLDLAECGNGCSPYWDPEPSYSIKETSDVGVSQTFQAVMDEPITARCE